MADYAVDIKTIFSNTLVDATKASVILGSLMRALVGHVVYEVAKSTNTVSIKDIRKLIVSIGNEQMDEVGDHYMLACMPPVNQDDLNQLVISPSITKAIVNEMIDKAIRYTLSKKLSEKSLVSLIRIRQNEVQNIVHVYLSGVVEYIVITYSVCSSLEELVETALKDIPILQQYEQNIKTLLEELHSTDHNECTT